MKHLEKIWLYPYTLYGVFVFFIFVFTAFPYAVFLTYFMPKQSNNLFLKYCKFWSKVWMFSSGMGYKFRNKGNYQEGQNYVTVSNHGSTLDMFTAAIAVKMNTKALAKSELKKVFLVGKLFATVSIFVDRKSAAGRENSRRLCTETLQNGYNILIFPEGSRNRTDKPLKDFYDGAFRMAIEAQKPIMAYCVIGVRSLMSMKEFLMRPGNIEYIYLEPYETKGLTLKDMDKLKNQVYADMEKCILENDPMFRKV